MGKVVIHEETQEFKKKLQMLEQGLKAKSIQEKQKVGREEE